MAANYSLSEFLNTAADSAKRAGEVEFFVAETDKACEDIAFNLLKQQFPGHKLFTASCGKGAFEWKTYQRF